jgi:NADH-quinone oxidoreductase subunit K
MTIPAEHVVSLSILLFGIGVVGVLVRRNVVAMLLSIELMFNGAVLALVGFDRLHGGDAFAIFPVVVIAIAIAEVAIVLAVVAVWLRTRNTLDVDDVSSLKW